ncbi:hypothetical protein MA16_Dca025707 [Dendrobium catenatum]|uniref:Uncharacterized protein n=1 Tax=Dendrobium catenatum TaxID=906689 RepID=A0A2I0X4X2_9ASPA|nr:hypothetical protein MA16_Dca025707 [Dendrobium catenatum]
MREHGICMRVLEALILILLVTQPTYVLILCYMTLKYGLGPRSRNIAFRVMDTQTQSSPTFVARLDAA